MVRTALPHIIFILYSKKQKDTIFSEYFNTHQEILLDNLKIRIHHPKKKQER